MFLAVAIPDLHPGSPRISMEIPWLLPLEAASPSPERHRTSNVVGNLGGFLPGFGKGLKKVSWWGTEVGHMGENIAAAQFGF